MQPATWATLARWVTFCRTSWGPSGSATKTFGNTRIDPHNWRIGVFAQDDIKINPDLTVNFGIRYDYLSNPENSLKFPALDPNNPTGIVTLVSGVVTPNLIKANNDTNNISPRVGFAFSPPSGGFFADGKSVVRGGFGIFYDSGFSNFVVNAAQASPNAFAGQLIQTTGFGLANATSLVPTISPRLSLQSTIDATVNNLVNPITYQYNLGVERQLPAKYFRGDPLCWSAFEQAVFNPAIQLLLRNYGPTIEPDLRCDRCYRQLWGLEL
jgi:TonB dependent receptor